MKRGVVIGIIAILVISICIAILAYSFSRSSVQQEGNTTNSNTALNTSTAPTPDPSADTDNDGLINAQEALWGTNPNNPDTDKDGYSDGKEVSACHNPLVPSPNDKLLNCDSSKNNSVATVPVTKTSNDQFFAPNLDLSGGSINLTQAYAVAVKDADKSPSSFSNFIANQPISTDLPKVNEPAIQKGKNTPEVLADYMTNVNNLESLADKPRLTIALNDFFNYRNTYGFTTLAESVEAFQSRVKLQKVPAKAMEYNKLLLSYAELLSATFRQISNFPNDQIKAMVAIRQLDAIDRQYYPKIVQMRADLLNPTE